MHISRLRDSRFLKKEDCDPPITVTIKTLTEENVAMEGQNPDYRWALHFDELDKPMILNSTNGQSVAEITGSEETDEWSGQKVMLYMDPSVMFGGKKMGGIRIRKPKKSTSKPEPAPEGVTEEDEIPF